MRGDPGPYMELDGPGIWVPRTVPYIRARQVAKSAMMSDDRLVYRGKVDAILTGFARDCDCDEVCELKAREDDVDEPEPPEGYDACQVPAWHFEALER